MPKVRRSKTDSIRTLVEVYEIEEALCVELTVRRYRLAWAQAARDYERVVTLLERRRARPVLPSPANVAEARRPAVSAMLPHFKQRVVPALTRPLASRFANLLGPQAEANALAELYETAERLWHLNPPPEEPVRPFEDPLVRDGIRYLYRAVKNRIISHYARGRNKRRESSFSENMASTVHSVGPAPSGDSTPLMSRLWDRFWQLCGRAKTNETAQALMESARLFHHGESVEDQFLFFHAWLDGDRLSGCAEPQWVRAHLQILLRLRDDALNVRKYRLKQIWKTARREALSRHRVDESAHSRAVT